MERAALSFERDGTVNSLVDIFGPSLSDVLRELSMLRETAHDKGRLESLKADRLQRIFKLAKAEVPFYRQVLKNIESFGDTPSVLASRDDLRKRPTEYFVADHFDSKRCLKSSTSGTSGNVFTVLNGISRFTSSVASLIRRLEHVGLSFGFRLAEIVTTDRVFLPSWDEKFNYLMGMSRTFRINLSTEELDESLTRLHYFDPEVVWGYPSNLIRLALLLQKFNIQLSPKVLYPFGERLTENARRFLTKSFKAPVHDSYGLMEAGLVAWQCENLSYHIDEERVLVELMPEEDGASRGVREIVLTTLTNDVMPMIRYRTGDYAIKSDTSCECGTRLVSFSRVLGRSRETFLDDNGTPVDWHPLERYLNSLDAYAWQIMQPEPGHLHINLAGDDVDAPAVEVEINDLFPSVRTVVAAGVVEDMQTVIGKMPVVAGKGDEVPDDMCSCLQYRT